MHCMCTTGLLIKIIVLVIKHTENGVNVCYIYNLCCKLKSIQILIAKLFTYTCCRTITFYKLQHE